jgi:hypothetical protein
MGGVGVYCLGIGVQVPSPKDWGKTSVGWEYYE